MSIFDMFNSQNVSHARNSADLNDGDNFCEAFIKCYDTTYDELSKRSGVPKEVLMDIPTGIALISGKIDAMDDETRARIRKACDDIQSDTEGKSEAYQENQNAIIHDVLSGVCCKQIYMEIASKSDIPVDLLYEVPTGIIFDPSKLPPIGNPAKLRLRNACAAIKTDKNGTEISIRSRQSTGVSNI